MESLMLVLQREHDNYSQTSQNSQKKLSSKIIAFN